MKRIGILTFPSSPSFGASLQMFSLYQTLAQEGYHVDILNYMNTFMQERKHISESEKHSLRSKISNVLSVPSQRKFKKFERNLTYVPNQLTNDKEVLKRVTKDFDKIICGSDQVWNPNITGGDMTYFLDFCKKEQRVSYAPSFEVSAFSDEVTHGMRKELRDFFAISVREKQGAETVYDLIGERPSLVLDPTMLQSADFWRTVQKKPAGNKLHQNYIAVFLFNQNPKINSFISRLEKETGLPCIKYTWSPRELLTGKKCVGQFGPKEWLWFIDNASYVVTDSFHGSVFSILFEKKLFVSSYVKSSVRLKNLLNEFGLDDRMVDENIKTDEILKEIDYEKVRQILDERIQESKKYLIDAIEGNDL